MAYDYVNCATVVKQKRTINKFYRPFFMIIVYLQSVGKELPKVAASHRGSMTALNTNLDPGIYYSTDTVTTKGSGVSKIS